jgi:hypothetical protein
MTEKAEKGSGTASRAIGAASTKDGQISGTTADNAVAKAMAMAVSNPNADSLATGQVTFSRNFKLVGFPAGGDISLSGVLAGGLLANNPNVKTLALVDASARITEDLDGLGLHLVSIGGLRSPWFDSVDNRDITFSRPLSGTVHLMNGTYSVAGSLAADASVDKSALNAGKAAATFFDSLTIGVSVVPEPGSLTLLATGALWLMGRPFVSRGKRAGGVAQRRRGGSHHA